MGHLWRRLVRNLGGVTKILLTDLIWRPKNLLTMGGIGVGVVQLYAGIGLLFAGSFITSLFVFLLGLGSFLAGGISFFDRPVSGSIVLGIVLMLMLVGPGVVFGVADTTHDAIADSVGTQGTQHSNSSENNSTTVGDSPSQEDEDSVGSGYRDGDTAADGCGTNDGDPSYNEDNDRDNDGLCDE